MLLWLSRWLMNSNVAEQVPITKRSAQPVDYSAKLRAWFLGAWRKRFVCELENDKDSELTEVHNVD